MIYQLNQGCTLITDISLLDRLKVDDIGGTRTIRADKCEKAPLAPKAELGSREEGQCPMHTMEAT